VATMAEAFEAGLDTTTPDPGYFGPDSVSWRVHHDPSALVGGLRALMLQSLQPEVMHGFNESTDTRDDPWGRLMRTANYVNTVVYGTHEEADTASARVRRVHQVLGLDRPEWLLWVHCGAVESWLYAHRVSGAPMTDAEADTYVEEQVIAAELVGCQPSDVPRTSDQLLAYFDAMRPQLSATDDARMAVRGVLWPPMAPRIQWLTPARPLWTVAATTALGLLPRWSRLMLAPQLVVPTSLAARATARTLRLGMVALPEQRRTSPHVAAARARLAA
jgi:uncharacterized protein (DUF2236 family)